MRLELQQRVMGMNNSNINSNPHSKNSKHSVSQGPGSRDSEASGDKQGKESNNSALDGRGSPGRKATAQSSNHKSKNPEVTEQHPNSLLISSETCLYNASDTTSGDL